jgi:hypothetical protein
MSYINFGKAVPTPIITTLEPKTGNPFIIMTNSNGSSTNSNIQIGNVIIFGDGTNPIIINANSSSAYPIVWPTVSGEINLLGINIDGQLVTTQVVQLGSSGNNEITCPLIGDIDIISTNNQNINITSSNNIAIVSNQISPLSSFNSILLALDDNGNIISTNMTYTYFIGNSISNNYISVDNTTNNNGINIYTQSSQNDITLNSGGSLYVFSGDLTTPTGINTSLLAINSSNQLITVSDSTPGTFGNLTATGIVTLGNFSSVNNTGNLVSVPTSGNLLLESGTGSNIVIKANGSLSTIKVYGTELTAPTSGMPYNVLVLDSNNNLSTSNGSIISALGSTALNKNYISVDNQGSTGITLNGVVNLSNAGFPLPGSDNTAMLSVNSSGEIGITVSSEQYKENIRTLFINRESFDKLNPATYNYKKQIKNQIGLIAEEVYAINDLIDLVILGKNNEPLSINYNALSVVVADQLLQDRKYNKKNIEKLLFMILKQQEEIEILKNELQLIQIRN